LTLQYTGAFKIDPCPLERFAMSLAFTVPDLACSACVDTVTKVIQAIDTTAQVTAAPTPKQVEGAANTSQTAIQQAIVAVGYTVA
jgi:copper chaperone